MGVLVRLLSIEKIVYFFKIQWKVMFFLDLENFNDLSIYICIDFQRQCFLFFMLLFFVILKWVICYLQRVMIQIYGEQWCQQFRKGFKLFRCSFIYFIFIGVGNQVFGFVKVYVFSKYILKVYLADLQEIGRVMDECLKNFKGYCCCFFERIYVQVISYFGIGINF